MPTESASTLSRIATGIRLRTFVLLAIVGSAAVLTLINYVLRVRVVPDPGKLAFLSSVNAGLNFVCTVFLLRGYAAIRRSDTQAHRRQMGFAFLSSALFLVGYLVYHAVHGETKFAGVGLIRPIYFFVLITHVVLSAVVVPLILVTFFLALKGELLRHKKLAKITLPIWLYVSVTGIVVYFMLRWASAS